MRSKTTWVVVCISLSFVGCSDDFRDTPPPARDGGGAGGSGGGGDDSSPGGQAGGGEAGIGGATGGAAGVFGGSGGESGIGGESGVGGQSGEGGIGGDAGPDSDPHDAEPDADQPDAPVPDANPSCPTGWDDCDGDPGNGCEADLTNLNHCLACYNECPSLAHASRSCTASGCGFVCDTGWDSCDGNAANGCEADLTSLSHCLTCNNACATAPHSSATCTGSGCGIACDPGWGSCDGNTANGCETDLTTTVAHCGACGQACTNRPNSTATCTSSQCGFACLASYEDCDGAIGNGCEVNLATDPNNCGACDSACGTANGAPSCSNSTCYITCNSGWSDCDGTNSNGCEVNVNTSLSNCGGCGVQCGAAHGTASCAAGSCQIACNAGYADCDGVNSNGCEVNLNTNGNHCGVCGRSCLGASCTGGLCVPQQRATATDFVIDDTYMYIISGTEIQRGSLAGGILQDMAVNVSGHDLALGTGLVIWTVPTMSGGLQFISQTPQSPLPQPTVMSSSAGSAARATAFDGSRFYWIGAGTIRRRTLLGSAEDLAFVDNDVNEIAVGGGYIYWAAPSGGRIYRVVETGGTPTAIVSNQSTPSDLVVRSSTVYWVNRGNGQVRRSTTSGAQQTMIVSGMSQPNSIVADDDHIWWTTATGEVWRVNHNGAGLLMLAEGQSSPTDVAVSDSHVYWLNTGTSSVYRVAK